MYTINDFATMSPMKYYDNHDGNSPTVVQKRENMLTNKNNEYMATVKKDGDWAMLIHYSKGNNLIRSRSISKVTGTYGDYTAKLPHICECMDKFPDNTVLLAEICWDKPNTTSNTVGIILRCLPAKAVERQKENKLKALVFDELMINNQDITNLPYESRYSKACDLVKEYLPQCPYFYPTARLELDNDHPTFLDWADEIIAAGGEGLVIQRKDNPYMPGTRSAWKTLKVKQTMLPFELKVVDVVEPNMRYEGDCPDTWSYWYYDMEGADKTKENFPVTKPYFYHWKNGIVVDVNGVPCKVASGLTDDDRAYLATEEAQALIKAGQLYAEVNAMQLNSLGALRHPFLIRLRDDMA